jgi:hypothetical protein
MATTLSIDNNLLEEARIIGKHATKTAAVNEALAEYIQRRKQIEIITMFHSIEYVPGYDYKTQRNKQ